METSTERLVQSNEGASQPDATPEVEFPTNTPFVNPEGDAGQVREAVDSPSPTVEGDAELDPDAPPPGYESVPKELWPDADGKPPQLTDRLLRVLRGKYFTVRHPFLIDCGHKLDMINQPKNNCGNCWFQFFNTHGELVQVADQFYRTHGKNAMIGMRGEKFVKNFGRFMVTVLKMKEEEAASESSNPEGSNPDSIDGNEVGTQATAASETNDQRGEVESRGISSGIHEQPVRD